MALTQDRKEAFRSALAEWVRVHGTNDWERLLAAWPEVSRATLFRVLASMRQAGDLPEPAPARRALTKRAAMPRVTKAKAISAVDEAARHLPASPSPAVIAQMGQRRAAAAFDFMAYFQTIVGDADLIREGLVKEVDGKLAVKNPVLMDKNIARRLGIVQAWLQSQEMIYNYERLREMFSSVIEAVGQADQDTQKRIIDQLRELNKRRGITVESLLM